MAGKMETSRRHMQLPIDASAKNDLVKVAPDLQTVGCIQHCPLPTQGSCHYRNGCAQSESQMRGVFLFTHQTILQKSCVLHQGKLVGQHVQQHTFLIRARVFDVRWVHFDELVLALPDKRVEDKAVAPPLLRHMMDIVVFRFHRECGVGFLKGSGVRLQRSPQRGAGISASLFFQRA